MSEENKKPNEIVLSWDIGIKNLAYCILEMNPNAPITNGNNHELTKHGFKILSWGLVNLCPEEETIVKLCSGTTKKGKVCGKNAKFQGIYDGSVIYFCKTHQPKQDETPTHVIKKQTKSARAKGRTPFRLAQRLEAALKSNPDFLNVDNVIVENQPSFLNPIMKSVQMLVFSYFAFHSQSTNNPNSRIKMVHNIPAKQKEKRPSKDPDWVGSRPEQELNERNKKIKSTYRKRKNICTAYAKFCIQHTLDKLAFVQTHDKQDDICEAFLQGTDWFLRQRQL